MKYLSLIIFYFAFLFQSDAQDNHVASVTEVINFGIVDISMNTTKYWCTERSSYPGYFSLVDNANFTGYSDQANIDGYVKKYGNTAFIFPVGNGKEIRTLEISNPNAFSDAYATAWIEGNPSNNLDPTGPCAGKHSVFTVAGEIESVSTIGQWDWQTGADDALGIGTTGNGEGLTITVSMPDMTSFADESALRLVGWNGSAWIDLSGKQTAKSNKINSKLSGTMIKGITAIAIGKITKKSFVKNAPIIPNNELESNNPFYTEYNSFTSTHEFKVNRNDSLQIYPNPITGNQKINLQFNASFDGKAFLTILNSVGQVVSKTSIQVIKGSNLLTSNVNNLYNGKYFIRIIGFNGEEITSCKQFIKN